MKYFLILLIGFFSLSFTAQAVEYNEIEIASVDLLVVSVENNTITNVTIDNFTTINTSYLPVRMEKGRKALVDQRVKSPILNYSQEVEFKYIGYSFIKSETVNLTLFIPVIDSENMDVHIGTINKFVWGQNHTLMAV